MTFKKTLLFFTLFLLVALPFYLFFIIFPVRKFNQAYNNAPAFVSELIGKTYPADLVIDVREGKVSVNRKSPYCLVIEPKTRSGIVFDQFANPANFMNGNTSVYSSLCNPYLLVGKNFVVYPDAGDGNKGTYKMQEIPSSVNVKITRDEVNKFASMALPTVLRVGRTFYFVGPFFMVLPVLLCFLLANLWYGLISMLLFKLTKMNKTITFKDAYAKSLFALFLYIVLDWVLFKFVGSSLLKLALFFPMPFKSTIFVVALTLLLERFYSKKK